MDVNRSHWVWMPHAGHFILGNRCSFKMNTYVNGYIVSTVGELMQEAYFSKMRKQSDWRSDVYLDYIMKDVPEDWREYLSRFDCVGDTGFYETMIFKGIPRKDEDEAVCCPYEAVVVGSPFYEKRYNLPMDAFKGHIEMCRECDKESPEFIQEDEDEDVD